MTLPAHHPHGIQTETTAGQLNELHAPAGSSGHIDSAGLPPSKRNDHDDSLGHTDGSFRRKVVLSHFQFLWQTN